MEKTEISEKVNKILSKYLKIPVSEIKDSLSSEEESEWDSVAHLKIVSDLENTFKIKFDIDEIVSLETVGKVKEIVIKKINS